jgi:signal transduction histidine kinase
LTNVYKHSLSSLALVNLSTKNDAVVISVSDLGKGFDSSLGNPWVLDSNKFGLLSINERVEMFGGQMTVHSRKNEGCQVQIRIPLRSNEHKLNKNNAKVDDHPPR